MGREARCRVRFNDEVGEGTVRLETEELVFRGPFRLRIRFSETVSVEAVDGRLQVSFPEGTAAFELGPAEAERWAERILHPPTLMDKLGVKPGARVVVLGVDDESFWADLRRRTDDVATGGGPADVVIWAVDDAAGLAALSQMEDWIQPDGAIWAVWRKARPELSENHVREAALVAGLVDVKVARFSESHSALKLVVPKACRR